MYKILLKKIQISLHMSKNLYNFAADYCENMRYLISGGGTGGHIFPAVSIANALKELDPEAQILFVGALGRMEMERVPQAGYKIIGLPVRGFNRAQPWKNVSVMMDLLKSLNGITLE